MEPELEKLIETVVDACYNDLPVLAAKPVNEKSLDDQGHEYLATAIIFLYEGYEPNEEQLQQLKETSASCALTYRDLSPKSENFTIEPDEENLLLMCQAFLHLYRTKVKAPSKKVTLH